jgi:hypothetical protein
MIVFRGAVGLSLALALALASVSSPARAETTYSAYEGPAVVKTGEGGTKIAKNGIDYWTSGTPPRRYQVIGMVQDKRYETPWRGHAIGSPSIAEKVKKAGGDAIIMQAQEEAGSGGGYGSGNGSFAFMAMAGSKTISTMLVVKYLPDEPAPSPSSAPDPSPSAKGQ